MIGIQVCMQTLHADLHALADQPKSMQANVYADLHECGAAHLGLTALCRSMRSVITEADD